MLIFYMPENINKLFFDIIFQICKYEVEINANSALIKPRSEEEYYKPIIIVKDLDELAEALENYINALNNFYKEHNNLDEYHTLEYFLARLLSNMAPSDALDLTSYINRRTFFLSNNEFAEYDEKTTVVESEDYKIYVQKALESPGLETPYILLFSAEINGEEYPLPLIRYAFDEGGTCHVFAVQFGRQREPITTDNFKKIINKANRGVNKYRNVSPSFVISFALFINFLKSKNVTNIVMPDFLFGRYRRYFGGHSEQKSDEILYRILNNFITLIQRMEYQFPDVEITAFPNDVDSYTHIKLNCPGQKRILHKDS